MNKFQQVFPRGMEGMKKTMYELSRFLELNWAKEIYSFFYKLCPILEGKLSIYISRVGIMWSSVHNPGGIFKLEMNP
jgi:hypothetical protein